MDVKHKFIRTYSVTDASVHDSQVMDDLLDDSNTSADVYADSAYRSAEINQKLEEQGYRDRTQHRAYRNTPLTDRQKATNRRRSSLRSRVEHVFGVQSQMAGSLLIRTVGLVRATAKIGLRNLAYNIKRYTVLARSESPDPDQARQMTGEPQKTEAAQTASHSSILRPGEPLTKNTTQYPPHTVFRGSLLKM